jgi:hypothetical protein
MTKVTLDKLYLLFIAVLSASLARLSLPATTYSAGSPWTAPQNLSVSGAASQPVVAAAPDGSTHVLWWDSISGEQYVHIGVTDTKRITPTTLSDIYGDRTLSLDPATQRLTVALAPPREVRVLTDAQGAVYAFWYDIGSRLLMEQITGGGRFTQTVSAGPVVAFAITQNGETGLQIAYIKSRDDQGSPAGVYYRTWSAGQWSAPVSIYSSSYFRSIKAGASEVSVASNGHGTVIVAWDDPYQGRSFYAHTESAGATWTAPQPVPSAGVTAQAHVAYTPNSEFMLVWRDPSAGACVLMQARSNDGMNTWTAPQRVLSGISRCMERWYFTKDTNDQMWLLGMQAAVSPITAAQTNQAVSDQAFMAVWDNTTWSAQAALGLSFYDEAISRTLSLACINAALSGNALSMVGCDTKGDVWFVRSQVNLKELAPSLARSWSTINVLSQAALGSINAGSLGPLDGYPALTTDSHGRMYAIWSQPILAGTSKISLFASVWDGQAWSQAVQVLDSPSTDQKGGVSDYATMAEQPSLAGDGADLLHAVWVSGPGGILYYSKVILKDALSAQDWSMPVALSIPSHLVSWPEILANQQGNSLYVIYAVPYNEKRGIYLLQSNNGGTTWSQPTLVFDAATAGWLSADKPQLTFDVTSGVLHAVWLRSELPGGVDPSAVYYANSVDNGKTWTKPVQLATGNVDWPRITVPAANQVLVTWNDKQASDNTHAAAPMSVWERSSSDGGIQWTDASRVPGFEHVSGSVDVVSDQAGIVHYTGVGMNSDGESSLLYAQKAGGIWNEQDAAVLGQKATLSNAATATLLPVTGQLGVLMRGWIWQADGTGQFGVLATTRAVSDTRVITPVATLTPLPLPSTTVTVELLLSPTPTQVPVAVNVTQIGQGGSSSGQSALVIAGIVAAVMVIGGIMLKSVIQDRRG